MSVAMRNFVGTKLIPKIICNQIRNVRSTVKIDKESFQLTLDVRQFKMEELKVKAKPDYVVVEGKHEKSHKNGYIMKRFVRKFKLPPGCEVSKIQSQLSPEGMLTVCAPRRLDDRTFPCETRVPIQLCTTNQLKADSTMPCESDKANKPT